MKFIENWFPEIAQRRNGGKKFGSFFLQRQKRNFIQSTDARVLNISKLIILFFLEKENGKSQDSVFLVILGKQGNTEIYCLGKAILRKNTILLYIENTHEFGKKEADPHREGGGR